MPITNDSLTEATLTGNGIFDVLMQAVNVHLDKQYDEARITGAEYAQVYLGSMTEVMGQSVAFLLARDKTDLELQILELQRQKIEAEVLKVQAEVTLVEAQVALQVLQIPKIEAETLLIGRQADNELLKGPLIEAQTCESRAKFDVLVEQKLKTIAETTLLGQKKVTEAAQTTGAGIDPDSVVGRQKNLYLAQTEGFSRDAEQKVADLLTQTWGVRRSTDDGTQANTTNKLDDATIGRAMEKLLSGINA